MFIYPGFSSLFFCNCAKGKVIGSGGGGVVEWDDDGVVCRLYQDDDTHSLYMYNVEWVDYIFVNVHLHSNSMVEQLSYSYD